MFYEKTDTCPCCVSESETFQRMLSCPSESTLEFQTEQLVQLEANLRNKGMPDDNVAFHHGATSNKLPKHPNEPQQ
jgi:hypothetical protein